MNEQVSSPGGRTFLDYRSVPVSENMAADVAILGIPLGAPYPFEALPNDQVNAPTAIRAASGRLVVGPDHWDFDLGGTVLADSGLVVVDCGDVPLDLENVDAHYRDAEAMTRTILDSGCALLVMGGDHGVPIPVFRALQGHGPITLVQVDAHLDWREERGGVSQGYSSPMRRAAEMDHIDQIFQIGLRAQGSARAQEVEAALDHGANLVTDRELQARGMQSILDDIPDGGTYYLTIDADGMDPSIMPAVAGPAPGGVTYQQMLELIHGLSGKGHFIGMDIVEITPKRDLNQISCITAGQLMQNFIGMQARSKLKRDS
jgi:agmatinase